jgi:hypothetical protein
MSLDNIQLTKETCIHFYSRSLVNAGSAREEEIEKKITINSLGENQQNILFIVKDADHKFLADDEMTLLSNLIAACKLSMADISLVNYSSNQYSYHQFAEQFHPQKILLFGVNTQELDLPFEIPFFQIQSFQKQLYMTAPQLKDFLNNTELKKQLWSSLQKLFAVKK